MYATVTTVEEGENNGRNNYNHFPLRASSMLSPFSTSTWRKFKITSGKLSNNTSSTSTGYIILKLNEQHKTNTAIEANLSSFLFGAIILIFGSIEIAGRGLKKDPIDFDELMNGEKNLKKKRNQKNDVRLIWFYLENFDKILEKLKEKHSDKCFKNHISIDIKNPSTKLRVSPPNSSSVKEISIMCLEALTYGKITQNAVNDNKAILVKSNELKEDLHSGLFALISNEISMTAPFNLNAIRHATRKEVVTGKNHVASTCIS
uniref:Uncharacterized protein n=1 Tax=Glossina pallidipes TaxID=7398 RepID=A0A1A9ZJT0_GLOPL